jgi:hypothetical protein
MAFLRRTLDILPAMVNGLTDEQFRWKPRSGNWSVLEILGHLVVEETQDFRIRVKMTLADPNQAWKDYDPEGIVVREKFNERDPQQTLAEFVRERKKSLHWLATLESPDWQLTYQHRRIGPLKAGDLFLSWVAHDQLHVRQIAKRCFEMINEDGRLFETRYAGNW